MGGLLNNYTRMRDEDLILMKANIKEICIRLIYVFAFIFALTYICYGGEGGNHLWKIISALPIFMIIFLCLVYLFSRKYLRFDFIGILLFLMIIYELAVSLIRKMFIMPNILMDVIAWPLLFWVFLDYSKENEISKYSANIITVIGMSLICAMTAFVVIYRFRHGSSSGSTVFTTYLSFSFLPLVYLYCNKRVSTVFNIIVAILMVLTLKRAAFIIVVVGIFLYYIINSYVAGNRGKKIQRLFVTMIILLALGLLGWLLIDRLNIGILKRLSSSVEDGGSGRTRIWELILNEFKKSPQSERIFGHGFHYVFYELRPFGISRFAHDSLIETLYDYGIVGLGLLVSLMIYLLNKAIAMVRTKSTVASTMIFSTISMIVLTAISYFFEQSVMTIPHVMIWGICIGRFIREKKVKTVLKLLVGGAT